MKNYLVEVSASDYIDVNAESAEEAVEKATEIAANMGAQWRGEIVSISKESL